MKQTAVEWFYWQIMYADVDVKVWKEIRDQALEMERQQIIDAHKNNAVMYEMDATAQAEQYYTQTFTPKND
jgi:hypothetical protein